MSSRAIEAFCTAVGVALGAAVAYVIHIYERYQMQQIGYRVHAILPASEVPLPEPIINGTVNVEAPPDEIQSCTICLNLMRSNQTLKTLQCNHKFHLLCFKNYVKNNNNQNTCPICRSNF